MCGSGAFAAGKWSAYLRFCGEVASDKAVAKTTRQTHQRTDFDSTANWRWRETWNRPTAYDKTRVHASVLASPVCLAASSVVTGSPYDLPVGSHR